LRDKRLRLPPLAGKNEFHSIEWKNQGGTTIAPFSVVVLQDEALFYCRFSIYFFKTPNQ